MEDEIIAAREICRAAAEIASVSGGTNKKQRSGVKIISCPRCGRFHFDTHGFCSRWMPELYKMDREITVAIMGCEVNGPEEAKFADIGITGAGKNAMIFRHGKIVQTVPADEADEAFAQELAK